MTDAKHYRATYKRDIIYLETWGTLRVEDLEEPANVAIEMAHKYEVYKLLDDIRGVDTSHIDFAILTKSVGILLKLRTFKKVAVVMEAPEVGGLFMSSLQTLHLSDNFRGFTDPDEAAAWLRAA